jgi:hypothetical protein
MDMKTLEGWKNSPNLSLYQYLEVGDVVDEKMAEYFLTVMPPVTSSPNLIQLGEPYAHIGGRGVYPTLKKTSAGWVYCGHCFRGTVSRET